MSLKKLLPSIKDPEIKKRVQAIIDDGKQLGSTHFDIGFYNLMYDSKTKEYKLIDLT